MGDASKQNLLWKDETMTAETGVKWLLRIIAITTIPALVAAVMPQSRLAGIFNWIEPGFSTGLLEMYITRCLMGVYAFLGVQAVIWSTDVKRYRPLIVNLCVFCIIAALAGLTALITTVPSVERNRVFWIIFIDLAEGLAHIVLLYILILRVPTQRISSLMGGKRRKYTY
jgi:hypothetical protein